MAKSPTPLRIATTSDPAKLPVARAVTRRESDLLSQVNELKEKLVLAEIAMDDKEAQLHKVVKKARAQKSYINQFEKKIDDIKLKNLDVTDKLYQLKSVAARASEIARKKHNQLKQIEKALEKHQQELMVTKRIQAQLMDVVVKRSNNQPLDRKQEPAQPHLNHPSKLGSGQALLQLPKTVGDFLRSQRKGDPSNLEKAYILLNTLKVASLNKFDQLKERLRTFEAFTNAKRTQRKTQKQAPQVKSTRPKVQWRRVSNSLPAKNGLYYVTDGKLVDIALFDSKSQKFKKTGGNFTIDYWCEKSN